MQDEHIFYNALALAEDGSYLALKKARARHGSWNEAWQRQGNREVDPGKEASRLGERGVRLLLREDDGYPPMLREIPHPPHALYIKGPLDASGMQVGIVGTRKATPEGKASARELARELAGRGITVVSGLAFGIDAAAHQGALDAGAPTWAVLARGLDAVYPASHRRLADDMLSRGGALISEYPFGSGPRPYRFLERNRIVSGVSRAVLMIEVPARSGAQATARFAAEQGRDVLVVPGPARHPNFRGSHRLIREGAALVADARDVLAELGLELPLPEADISPETGLIRSFLRTVPDAVSIDEIAERANLPPRVVSEHLTLLLLEGKVREEAGLYRNIVE